MHTYELIEINCGITKVLYTATGRQDLCRLDELAELTPWGVRGRLNPAWVEWLMGFPIGWTDLDA